MTPAPAALRSLPAACAALVVLALALPGCGKESAAPETATAREAAAGSRPDTPAASTCPQRLTAFVGSLEALRSRLAVGLAYEQYVAEVKRLRSAYARVPADRLTLDCLATGRPAERALNRHIDAANAWGECLADASCTTATIEPLLQREWRTASRHLSEVP